MPSCLRALWRLREVYSQDSATRLSEVPCSSRSSSMPVTLTRSPTWRPRFIRCRASDSSMVLELFLMKPDFQLRPFGASSPSVFFSRNASLSCTRQPTMVTGSAFCTAFAASPDCAFAAGAAGAFCGLAGTAVFSGASVLGGATDAAPVGSDERATISIAVPTMHTTMRPIAALRLPVKRGVLFEAIASSFGPLGVPQRGYRVKMRGFWRGPQARARKRAEGVGNFVIPPSISSPLQTCRPRRRPRLQGRLHALSRVLNLPDAQSACD